MIAEFTKKEEGDSCKWLKQVLLDKPEVKLFVSESLKKNINMLHDAVKSDPDCLSDAALACAYYAIKNIKEFLNES